MVNCQLISLDISHSSETGGILIIEVLVLLTTDI